MYLLLSQVLEQSLQDTPPIFFNTVSKKSEVLSVTVRFCSDTTKVPQLHDHCCCIPLVFQKHGTGKKKKKASYFTQKLVIVPSLCFQMCIAAR